MEIFKFMARFIYNSFLLYTMGIGILTDRQAEVIRMEALGFSQEEISKALNISQPRVSSALKKAKEKIERARETLDFYEEINYVKSVRKSGFRGEAVLR
jgi:Tfx family DNA-binding protein